MKKFLLMAAAALISVSAMAIDKVQKKTTTKEITSVEELASSTFMLTNANGQVMYTPDGWDVKVIASAEFTGNGQGGFYKLEAYDGHWLIPVYENEDGTTRRTFWAGNQYVNSQPVGGNVIFGLDGVNAQHGQDGPNLAVWDITYSEGNGFAFHCVGRDIYLGYDASAARPVDNIVYWTATGKVTQYDAAEVTNAYNEVKDLDIQQSVKTAMETAKAAYDAAPSFGKLTTYGDAVNAAIAIANLVPGMDYTEAIANPNFDGSINGWTDAFNNNTAKNHGYQGASYANGDVRISGFMECWTWEAQLGNGSLYQNIDLPAGEYTMSADVIAVRQSGGVDKANYTGVYIFAESDVLFKSDACATDNNAPVHYSFTFNTTGGTTKIGLMTENTNCNWVAFDNVHLVYEGPLTINPYQEALKEQVKEADADRSDEKAGIKAITDYADAYAAAVTATETDKQTDEYYKNAASALTNASNALDASVIFYATLSDVYNSSYEKIEDFCETAKDVWYDDEVVSQIGVNAKNGTLDESYDYATKIAAVYNACVEAQKEYLKGDYTPVTDVTPLASATWVGQSGTVAQQYCPDMPGAPERYKDGAFTGDVMTQTLTGLKKGTYRVTMRGGASYTSGRGFEGATGQNHAFFFANDALQSMEVYDRTSIAAGTLDEAVLECGVKEDGVLKFGIQNITVGANWFVINLDKIEYISTDLPPVDATLAVGSAQWATFIAPFEVTVPAGVTAYTVDGFSERFADGTGILEMTAVTTIPANTPVVLNAESPVNETVSGVSEAEGMNYTVGLLTGVYADLEITDGYVLQNQSEKGIGFYAVDGAKTVPANHAYLTVPAAGIKAFTFGEATAIEAVEALTAGKAQIFDLNGRQINKLQKGINIVNGVKVLVK